MPAKSLKGGCRCQQRPSGMWIRWFSGRWRGWPMRLRSRGVPLILEENRCRFCCWRWTSSPAIPGESSPVCLQQCLKRPLSGSSCFLTGEPRLMTSSPWCGSWGAIWNPTATSWWFRFQEARKSWWPTPPSRPRNMIILAGSGPISSPWTMPPLPASTGFGPRWGWVNSSPVRH